MKHSNGVISSNVAACSASYVTMCNTIAGRCRWFHAFQFTTQEINVDSNCLRHIALDWPDQWKGQKRNKCNIVCMYLCLFVCVKQFVFKIANWLL